MTSSQEMSPQVSSPPISKYPLKVSSHLKNVCSVELHLSLNIILFYFIFFHNVHLVGGDGAMWRLRLLPK